MKKIISLFVIATMIVAAMSISTSAADVTSTSQFAFDGTVNKLTANITADATVHLTEASQNLVVDLNGFTWECIDKVLKIDNGATAEIYDSSEAKTGKIDSGNDAIDISNGTLTLKNITVVGGTDACDAVYADGGNITIEGCTLSAGKAGIDSSNGSAGGGVSVVATVKDTTFASYANPGDRNCAIELRASSDDQVITLVGNNVFTNNKIMIKSDYEKGLAAGIVAGEGATVSFTDPAAVANKNNYTYSEITYTYTAPDGGEGEDEDEGGNNPETGDAFVVVAATVAAFALAGVVVSKKVHA